MITTVPVGDVQVEVELHGHGAPLLMLHGWEVDRRLMTGCLEPLFAPDEPWLRVYPDLPGRGGTPPHSAVDSSDATADLVVAVMAAVAPGRRFAVVGESYGGYLARGVLARRPDLLGLALICPMVTTGDRDLPRHAVLERDDDLVAAIDPALRPGFEANNVRQTPAVWARYVADVLPGLAAADRAYLEHVLGPRVPLSDEDATTDAPVLVVAGRQDAAVGYRQQVRLAERFDRATLAVLDTAGHNAQFEQPELFGALVREWLDRVSRA